MKSKKREPFNIFQEKFEGTIEYKTLSNNYWKSLKESGIIQASCQGDFCFFLIFDDEEDEVPRKAIPYNNIIDIEIAEEIIEEPEIEDSFDLRETTRAQIIEEGDMVGESLDLQSKEAVGTESVGEIDLSDAAQDDISF